MQTWLWFLQDRALFTTLSRKARYLSKSIVEDKVDPQNVFTAVRLFNPAVQMIMIQKGYREMAYFIEVMRNWFHACNDRG